MSPHGRFIFREVPDSGNFPVPVSEGFALSSAEAGKTYQVQFHNYSFLTEMAVAWNCRLSANHTRDHESLFPRDWRAENTERLGLASVSLQNSGPKDTISH